MALFASLLVACLATFASALVVNTQFGPVDGGEDLLTGIHYWKGVPFASPPTGDLRWKAPQDPRSWVDPIAAKDFASDCLQWNSMPGANDPAEDCLYLNVWAPKDANNLPVGIWFYGDHDGILLSAIWTTHFSSRW